MYIFTTNNIEKELFMIRKMNYKDIDRVLEIWHESIIKSHDFIDQIYWDNAKDQIKNKYLIDSDTYVYEKNNTILGFISIWSEDTVGMIFVSIEHQANHIGSEMINYVKKKYHKLAFSVFKKNILGNKFAKKNDFKISYQQVDTNTCEIENVYIWEKRKLKTFILM
ncbi:MAG: GNAT family N-acetyltransferase [Firmicutes bacterium]|jgi:putative acetyltransferase|nr:GNAT family N-acetyltransferase [Bacillota bacterium]